MKRLFISLMVIITLLYALPVYAESDSDSATGKEILFRGIPWGSCVEEVEQAFKGEDFFYAYDPEYFSYKSGYVLYDDYDAILDDLGLCGYADVFPDFKVAGYDVDSVELHFAYQFDDETYGTENVDALFFGGKYWFAYEDFEKTSADLIDKLNSLYGEYTESFGGDNQMFYQWYGSNDTTCVLHLDTSYDSNSIHLNYAWLGADTIIDEMSNLSQTILEGQEDEIRGNGDTDGL